MNILSKIGRGCISGLSGIITAAVIYDKLDCDAETASVAAITGGITIGGIVNSVLKGRSKDKQDDTVTTPVAKVDVPDANGRVVPSDTMEEMISEQNEAPTAPAAEDSDTTVTAEESVVEEPEAHLAEASVGDESEVPAAETPVVNVPESKSVIDQMTSG